MCMWIMHVHKPLIACKQLLLLLYNYTQSSKVWVARLFCNVLEE